MRERNKWPSTWSYYKDEGEPNQAELKKYIDVMKHIKNIQQMSAVAEKRNSRKVSGIFQEIYEQVVEYLINVRN